MRLFLPALGALLLAGGCAGTLATQLTPPERHTVVRGQLVVHSDFPIASHHRLLDDLTARRGDLQRQLGLPGSDEPIDVYLFESGDRLAGFMKLAYPDFPLRRACFIETDTRLAVYAQWGDHVAEDLRHEVTHGYLHSVAPGLPLWLDEGLAETFEVPRGQLGLNRAQLDRALALLDQTRWRPNLRRLDALDPAAKMGPDDYAEAWAWTHFLLHGQPESRELLRRYLHDLRRDGATEPLSSRLARRFDHPGESLIGHLRALAATR